MCSFALAEGMMGIPFLFIIIFTFFIKIGNHKFGAFIDAGQIIGVYEYYNDLHTSEIPKKLFLVLQTMS